MVQYEIECDANIGNAKEAAFLVGWIGKSDRNGNLDRDNKSVAVAAAHVVVQQCE